MKGTWDRQDTDLLSLQGMHSTCEGHGKAENGKPKETSFFRHLSGQLPACLRGLERRLPLDLQRFSP